MFKIIIGVIMEAFALFMFTWWMIFIARGIELGDEETQNWGYGFFSSIDFIQPIKVMFTLFSMFTILFSSTGDCIGDILCLFSYKI